MPTKSAITFGLVHIPISLHTATTDNDVHFNQLHNVIDLMEALKASLEQQKPAM